MQSFNVSFSLGKDTLPEDVLNECINWITDSPYSDIPPEEIQKYNNKEEFTYTKNEEEVSYTWAEDEEGQSVHSLRYKKGNTQTKWITEISYIKNHEEFWVSIKASQESSSAASEHIEIKKPVLVIRLLNRFGGGVDGDLPVTIEPIELKDDDAGLMIAKALIKGETVNRLPVVYISASYNNYRVIPQRLARALCGMAHVITEPSRIFSQKIRPSVSSRNVYGGAVGIYWPNGSGTTLFKRENLDIKDFEKSIYDKVCSALLTLSPAKKCSWDEVRHTKNRNSINKLKSEGASAAELVELYESELEEKEENISDLTKDIETLRGRIRSLEARNPVQRGLTIDKGEEDDFYENEIIEIIFDALQNYLEKCVHSDSRREHVIKSILESNEITKTCEEKQKTLKLALKGYTEMNKKIKATLEELGFELTSEGKHWKLTYQDDDRYTYVLPKSGSDFRGGMNATADIINTVY